jgi:UDP-glucose 4-epimerase
MVQNRIGCPKKANKDLGFVYEIGLEQGLKDLIDWRSN